MMKSFKGTSEAEVEDAEERRTETGEERSDPKKMEEVPVVKMTN